LKDAVKRAEYDRTYVRTTKREFEEFDPADYGKTKRRREDFDREATAQWSRRDGSKAQDPHSAARRENARKWKVIAREDYLARLRKWVEFQKQQLFSIEECQRLMNDQKFQLGVQEREGEEEVTKMFQEAITRSCQPVQNHPAVLGRLLDARRNFTIQLEKLLEGSQARLRLLVQEMEDRRRGYEEEEARLRKQRIREALDILGPRDLNPALFSVLDRRGRAINYWKALARVKSAVKFPFSSICGASEGPWHQYGQWERLAGDFVCGRCDQGAFHIIPECGPAKCPGCGMIACNDCYRELRLLREYGKWMCCESDDSDMSLFSLDFDTNAEWVIQEDDAYYFPFAAAGFGVRL
jgi:hypothetical protein